MAIKDAKAIGKSYSTLKQTTQLKQTTKVGKQEFQTTDDEGVELASPITRIPLGSMQNATEQIVLTAEQELAKADAEFFAKRQASRDAKATNAAKDLADADARGLNEGLNVQKSRMKAEMEVDFFCCVMFQSEDQRRAFFEAIKWNWKERGGIYIDGQELAKQLNIPLPPGPTWKAGEPKDIWADFSFDESFFTY
jgi:hypothetical protein